MNILVIGDVVGDRGTDRVCDLLERLRSKYRTDFCVVNGENASRGNGISRNAAERLLANGADCITLGNHTFRQKDAPALLSYNKRVIRPLNFPFKTPGSGVYTVEVCGARVCVFSAMGRVYMDPTDCPFQAMDRALDKTKGDINIVDFHGEATSEKRAMGFYLDGRVSVVFGTHTHIQTSDIQILPKGTGYITDVGMCGPYHSCLGVDKSVVISKFTTAMPQRFVFSDAPAELCGASFTVDEKSGKTTACEAFRVLPEENI